jgi:hypothetical protein
MAAKVTLYVRDEDLWRRAREVSGPAGLSALVHQCLGAWLDRTGAAASEPSVFERARRLRRDADALVHAIEQEQQRPRSRASRSRRRPSRS